MASKNTIQLRPPVRIKQVENTCWAASLSSFLTASTREFSQLLVDWYAVDAVIDYVRSKGSPVMSDGSLRVTKPRYPEWSQALSYFGLGVEYFYPSKDLAGNEIPGVRSFSYDYVKQQILQDNYLLCAYEDPLWAKRNIFYLHTVVVFGLVIGDLPMLKVMDPQHGAYMMVSILPELTYLVTARKDYSPPLELR